MSEQLGSKRKRNPPQNYYEDSVKLTKGKYHGSRDQWDGGPRQGWTDAYNGHSKYPTRKEILDAEYEDDIIRKSMKGSTITKSGYQCDDFIVEDEDNEDEEEETDMESKRKQIWNLWRKQIWNLWRRMTGAIAIR